MKTPTVSQFPTHFQALAEKLSPRTYLERNGNRLERILCKCGVPIRSWEDVGPPETRRLGGGTTQVIHRVAFVPSGAYREVELAMTDGSKHVTAVCSTCAGRTDAEFWTRVYLCDVAQWIENGASPEHPLLIDRLPTTVIRVTHGG